MNRLFEIMYLLLDKKCITAKELSRKETTEEMIESCITFMLKYGSCPYKETARNMMLGFLPRLKR